MTTITQQQQDAFILSAAAHFMRLSIVIPRKEMNQKLPKTVQDFILAKLALEGTPQSGVDFNIQLFGDKQKEFKKACIAPGAALRNFLYDNSYAGDGSDRIVHVLRVIDLYPALEAMKAVAVSKFNAFLPHYDEYCDRGRAVVDHNFPFVFEGKRISEYLDYPTKAEFKRSFEIELGAPMPVAGGDMSKLSIPADLASKWAGQAAGKFVSQLDAIREVAIKTATTAMARCVAQFGPNGKRIHETVITEARHAAMMLREMADGVAPRDIRLITLADDIDKHIGSIKDVETLKTTEGARDKAAKAARSVQSKLRQISKEAPPVVSAPKAPSKVVRGGLLGKKKAPSK